MEMFRIVKTDSGIPTIEKNDSGYWFHICSFYLAETRHYAEKFLEFLQPEIKSSLKLF